MRIPTSTLVMGLLTCVPFGLAIRDTVTGKTGGHAYANAEDLDDEYGDHVEYGGEAFEARMRAAEEAAAAVERREAEAQAARAQQLVVLYGAEPASLGTAFEGLRLGAPEAELDGAMLAGLHRLERTTGTRIALRHLGGILSGITISARHSATPTEEEALCDSLADRLSTAWGAGAVDDRERVAWLHPAAGQRAVLSEYPVCALEIDRYAPISTWLDRTSKASVVPLWAIGQPVQRLVDVLGPQARISEGVITWSGPGLGAGLGDTSLIATVERGKIVGLDAAFDEHLAEDVTAHLTKLYGEPSADGDNLDQLRWNSKPPISVEAMIEARAHLRAGKQP